MATSTLKVPQAAAAKLFRELEQPKLAKADSKKMAKGLMAQIEALNGDSIDDLDLTPKSKTLMEELQEAIEDEKKIVVVGGDDEDDSVPVKTKTTKSTKKTAKKSSKDVAVKTQRKSKSKKTRGAAGKTDKDTVFEAWLKNPTAAPKAIADKLEDKLNAKATTISHWVSDFKRGGESVGYPRSAKDKKAEIKAALKAVKAAK